MPKMKFVSPSVWLVARTEELQRIKKKILENGRKRALKGPKIKISKNKKLRFFLMSQGVLCQKIRFLGQKLWPLAGEQTDIQTETHTEISITEDTIRASVFKASASGMSGPIITKMIIAATTTTTKHHNKNNNYNNKTQNNSRIKIRI